MHPGAPLRAASLASSTPFHPIRSGGRATGRASTPRRRSATGHRDDHERPARRVDRGGDPMSRGLRRAAARLFPAGGGGHPEPRRALHQRLGPDRVRPYRRALARHRALGSGAGHQGDGEGGRERVSRRRDHDPQGDRRGLDHKDDLPVRGQCDQHGRGGGDAGRDAGGKRADAFGRQEAAARRDAR